MTRFLRAYNLHENFVFYNAFIQINKSHAYSLCIQWFMFILIYYNNNVNALKAKFTWTQYKLIEIILRNTYSEYFKGKPF